MYEKNTDIIMLEYTIHLDTDLDIGGETSANPWSVLLTLSVLQRTWNVKNLVERVVTPYRKLNKHRSSYKRAI
jgi:hypothetical protein